MLNTAFYEKFRLDDSVARQAGFNPYYPLLKSGLDELVKIGDHEFVDLASNNYLGLANDPRVNKAAKAGIDKYGVSLCATPIASGYSELFREAEQKLSDFMGLEDAVIFPSCYQANNGLFPAITEPEDLILVDRYAHASLLEGIKASSCPFRLFRHNDMDHLENLLMRKRSGGQVFVVTESVFSTEGRIAPFKTINSLCRKYGAIPVVDDSHGIGVIGSDGSGILSHSGISDYDGIYTASLGKALSASGGMIGGKKSLIRYLRYSTSHLIYSTAILPASLMALLKVLSIIRDDFEPISKRMWSYAHCLRDGLNREGFNLTNSQAPINSIRAGNSVETLTLAKWFYEQGILTTAFVYPSVPEREGRIRIIAGANFRESTIEHVLNCVSNYQSILV